VVAHISIHSYLGDSGQKITVVIQPRQKVSKTPILTNKLGMVVHCLILAVWEVYVGGLLSKACPGQKWQTIILKFKSKKEWGSSSSG
jgi:hypothetical protein